MTYLVGGGGGGGGVDSVNGDSGPAVVLIPSEIGALPGIVYANEATLIAATPANGDGTLAYASTEDTYWKRTEGKWLREGSNANAGVSTDYSGLSFKNGDTTGFQYITSGEAILNGSIFQSVDHGDGNLFSGLITADTLLTDVTVSTAAQTTVDLDFGGGPETVNVGKITFTAGGSFTGNFANIWGNAEKLSIWSSWDALATPVPVKANNFSQITLVYLSESTTAADVGWYAIYDYANNLGTNDAIYVIPMSQIFTILTGGTPALLAMSTNAGCKASVFIPMYNSNPSIPAFIRLGQEYYQTNGAGVAVMNNGTTLSGIASQNEPDGTMSFGLASLNYGNEVALGYFSNDAIGVVSNSIVIGQNSNVASAVPIFRAIQSGTGPHIKTNALASAPAMSAGEISYVGGAVNRWVYGDNIGNKNIANTSDLYTARIQPIVSAANVTPVATTDDVVNITAQAVGLTIKNQTGTPVNFQRLIIRILDNGAPQTITFEANYIPMGVALPVTTVAGKIMRLEFEYDSVTSKFGLIQLNQEA